VVTRVSATPFGRAHDLSTKTFGPAVELEGSVAADESVPFAAAVQPNRFAVLLHGSTDAGLEGRFYRLAD
jgi:hypothetical protein